MPAIKQIVGCVQKFVDWLNGMDEGTKKVIVTVALLAAALGPVLIVVGKVISAVGTIMTVVPKIAGVINTVKTAFAALNTTMLANPIVLVIAAIIALVAAFIYLWNNCEEFREFWINLWNQIKEAAVAVWEGLKAFFTAAWEAISVAAKTIWEGIKTFFSGIWESIKLIFSAAAEEIRLIITTYFNLYKTIIITVFNAIKLVVTTVWNAIKTVITTVVTAIQTFLTTAWNAIKMVITTTVNAIKTVIVTVWNAIKTAVTTVVNTKEEIEAMPNGAELLSIYPENDIETYRDVLYFVAQVLGGFFCINREGRLELRKYGTVPVLEIKGRHRFSSSFSDFITRYTAVSSTNLRTQTAEYYALETDDGLTMNLGVNPLLQFGLEETRRTLCENILADLYVISYVPFDSSTIGNPALDLGDVLTFSGGQADGTQTACITSIEHRIGGRQSIRCVGKNPRLAQAKSKNDKNISGLLNQIEAGKIGIHTFTNASAYTINDSDVRIISIEFASSEKTHVQFFGQVIVDVAAVQEDREASAKGSIVIPANADGAVGAGDAETGGTDESGSTGTGTGTGDDGITVEVELPVTWKEDGMAEAIVTFVFNDEEILLHHPAETWHSGKHTFSLYYPIDNVIPNITNTFEVYLRMANGTGSVDTGGCIAAVSGQAMAAAAAWDGKINIEETAARFMIGGGIQARGYGETVKMETMELVQRSYSDHVAEKYAIGAFCRPVVMGQEV